ncbi:MAG: DUF2452 domain-containing protein [Chromatiales bacterium]|jgi:hypothetical protein
MNKSANPQGKGLTRIALLTDIKNLSTAPAKPVRRIASELFTSLFVLQSDFSFKPVIGQTYWLYRKQQRFCLSLIAPGQWHEEASGKYIGECCLQSDLTWTLQLSKYAERDQSIQDYIKDRQQAFATQLEQAKKLQDCLPVYLPELPFYRRAFASALASSLASSMRQSGIAGLNYQQALALPTSDQDN